jgi:hypothetical protein
MKWIRRNEAWFRNLIGRIQKRLMSEGRTAAADALKAGVEAAYASEYHDLPAEHVIVGWPRLRLGNGFRPYRDEIIAVAALASLDDDDVRRNLTLVLGLNRAQRGDIDGALDLLDSLTDGRAAATLAFRLAATLLTDGDEKAERALARLGPGDRIASVRRAIERRSEKGRSTSALNWRLTVESAGQAGLTLVSNNRHLC